MEKFKKKLCPLLISLCFVVVSAQGQSGKDKQRVNTEVNFPVSSPSLEENYLNTVTTKGPDGVHYKLVQIGDRLPKLYVNNNLIATDDLGKYDALIQRLNTVLWQRQKTAAREKEADMAQQQEAIINELVKDHFIKSAKDVLSFRLTANDFMVNGKVQSFSTFSRYMKKYIRSNDNVYQFNYSK
jgi:hypothetical protein